MPPDVIIVLAASASVPLGLFWVEWHRRRDDQRANRARCEHRPGKPLSVAHSRMMFKQVCVKCGSQRHCNSAGEAQSDWEL